MSEWKSKRFWQDVEVSGEEGGFGVRLDGRPVRSPNKTLLVMPTRALADAVAAEWRAQEDVIDPLSMPMTRTVNSALDKVAPQQAEVASMLAEYGGSDLLCYRADSPRELVARQNEAWDPLLDWADDTFGARLRSRAGVMFFAQDEAALARLRAEVDKMSAFELAGFHDLVALSGSLIIALAATRGYLSLDELWLRSRVDELWQAEQWGQDDEAMAVAEVKKGEFLHAGRVWALLQE